MITIECKLNASEALLRGHKGFSDMVKLLVVPQNLGFKRRDMLAKYLHDGGFKDPDTRDWITIPQPNTAGLKEKLDELIEIEDKEGA